MMFLKAADPDGYAVTDGLRRYPVRGGVFLIDPDDRERFKNFAVADHVPDDVAAELVELGSWPADDEPIYTTYDEVRPDLGPVIYTPTGEEDGEPDDDTEPQEGNGGVVVTLELDGKTIGEAVTSSNSETTIGAATNAADEQDDTPAKPELDYESLPGRTRTELNALAGELGVEEPEKLPNKVAVVNAIIAANA